MKRKLINIRVVVVLIIIAIVVPILIGVGMNSERSNYFTGSAEGWLGFWGGYIGAILGMVGAYCVARYQIKIEMEEERERIRAEKLDNTFFNLIDLYMRIKESIPRIDYYDAYTVKQDATGMSGRKKVVFDSDDRYDIFDIILKESISEKEWVCGLREKKIIFSNIEQFTVIYEAMAEEVVGDEDIFYSGVPKRMLEKLKTCKEKRSMESLDEFHNFLCKNISDKTVEVKPELRVLYEKMKKESIPKLTTSEECEVISNVISFYHQFMGNYFRIAHRVFKLINESKLEKNERKKYLGIFRALFSEKEMLVLFYNAFYTARGEGLKRQLQKTNFFGEPQELPDRTDSEDRKEPHFFSFKNLIFDGEEIVDMRNCRVCVGK